jgi:hypothetical protein
MNKMYLLLGLFFGCTVPRVAIDNDLKTETIVESGLSKLEIYNKAIRWFFEPSGFSKMVLEVQDSAKGVLIGHGITNVDLQMIGYAVNFTMRIDIKDNTCGFKSFNYNINGNSSMSQQLANRAQSNITNIEKSLFKYLSSEESNKDFYK